MMINTETYEGITYYSMSSRGIDYTLRFNSDEWELHSHRKALGRSNVGTFKFFKTIEDVESSIKAFKGISSLIN